MSCIYFSTVTYPSNNQDSCRYHSLIANRTWHWPVITWHKDYKWLYLLQFVSSDSMDSFVFLNRCVTCNNIESSPFPSLFFSHHNSGTVRPHIKEGQMFETHLPLFTRMSLQWLCHTAVHQRLVPTVQIMTAEWEGERFHLCKAQLWARQEHNKLYGSIRYTYWVSVHFTSLFHS